MFAGEMALGGGVLEVARAAVAAPAPAQPRAPDFFLDGLAAHFDGGYPAGLPILRRALDVFGIGMSVDEELRWHWLAGVVARLLWDDRRWEMHTEGHVRLARGVGALSELPLALNSRAMMMLFAGDLTTVASLIQELQATTEATGSNLAPYAALGLAAFRGAQAEAATLIDVMISDATRRGEGIAITFAEWASAVLNNGVGDFETAMRAAQRASEHAGEDGCRDLGGGRAHRGRRA